MFINSHIASGYIASWFETNKKEWIVLWVFAAFVPDIDGLWSKTVVDHHSVLHTPIFWIVICGTGWLIGWFKNDKIIRRISYILFLGTQIHLMTDYITARTVGIKWLYPFNDVDYFLYGIMPEKGEIPVWEMLVPPYISFYFENRVLAMFEVMINIIALVLYFFSGKKAI
tara:strand:+ start:415 stop:924 length:510 start_codon:yes stop_codon:yes gene_type:complete